MYNSSLRLFSLVLLATPLLVLGAPPSTGTDDLTFEGQVLVTLHGANMMEIAAGKLAVAKSTSPAIQQFGAELVKDHSAADEQVLTLVAQRNVPMPAAPASDPNLGYVSGLTGEAFDRAFIQMMLDDHIKAIEMVQSAQKRIANVPVAAFLKSLLPTLESHRDTAVALSKGLRAQL
jgi:putative membrane protein